MNDRTRATVVGILAWATFGTINGAVIGAMIARFIGIAGPHTIALCVGAASGAALGIISWLIRAARKRR